MRPSIHTRFKINLLPMSLHSVTVISYASIRLATGKEMRHSKGVEHREAEQVS